MAAAWACMNPLRIWLDTSPRVPGEWFLQQHTQTQTQREWAGEVGAKGPRGAQQGAAAHPLAMLAGPANNTDQRWHAAVVCAAEAPSPPGNAATRALLPQQAGSTRMKMVLERPLLPMSFRVSRYCEMMSSSMASRELTSDTCKGGGGGGEEGERERRGGERAGQGQVGQMGADMQQVGGRRAAAACWAGDGGMAWETPGRQQRAGSRQEGPQGQAEPQSKGRLCWVRQQAAHGYSPRPGRSVRSHAAPR